MASDLPSPNPAQAYVHASVLEAGHLLIAEKFILHGSSPTKSNMVPSMAFLLRHSQSNKKIIFDLGIRTDYQNFPPAILKIIQELIPVEVPIDAVESLRRGGLEPKDIDIIILSHVHFDHVGDPDLFPSSHFVVGDDSKELLAQGYSPNDTEPAIDSRFTKNLLPEDRTTFVSRNDWTPLGPFPRTHDFFGDGSVYLVDAPGHLGGHLNLLVRTSANGSWLFLGGDSAHDVRLLTGAGEIAMFPHAGTGALICLHANAELAKVHISRIRKLSEDPKVLVLIAHDWVWYEENKDKGVMFPGEIPPT